VDSASIFHKNTCEILHISQGLYIYIKCLRTCFLYCLLNLVIQLPFCSCRFSLRDNILYIAVLCAITREAIRSEKWKKINSVAKGKVTRNNELRHVHLRTYTAGSANTRLFEQALRRGICLNPRRRRRIPSACLINDTSLTMERRNFL